jgi:hypothetical protein
MTVELLPPGPSYAGLVPLAAARSFLKIDTDASGNSPEDGNLILILNAAQAYVFGQAGVWLENGVLLRKVHYRRWRLFGPVHPHVPEPLSADDASLVKVAILSIAGHYNVNREATAPIEIKEIPLGVVNILNQISGPQI